MRVGEAGCRSASTSTSRTTSTGPSGRTAGGSTCRALAKEVARLETVELVEHRLPSVGQGEREAVARRLWAERERRDTLGYAVGYRAAFEWARERGDHEAVAALAAGRALQAGTPPGVDGPDGARRLVGGRPCGGDLVRPRREVAQSLERPGGVPREEVAAFHRGVRGGPRPCGRPSAPT